MGIADLGYILVGVAAMAVPMAIIGACWMIFKPVQDGD